MQNVLTIQPPQVAGILAATNTRNQVRLPDDGPEIASFLINVTAGGTATGTLALFVQDSMDNGTTWDDLISSLTFVFGSAIVTQRFWVNGLIVPSTITTAASTNLTQGSAAAIEALAAGSARQGPFGNLLRVREKVTGPAGSPVGPTYSISAVFK